MEVLKHYAYMFMTIYLGSCWLVFGSYGITFRENNS